MIAGVGMLFTFSTLTACSAVYAQTGNSGAGSAVIAMIFLFYGVAAFAWPGLTVAYCAEILPFNIRAKGMAINFALTATASVFNQYGKLTIVSPCQRHTLTEQSQPNRTPTLGMEVLFRIHRDLSYRMFMHLVPFR